LIIPNHLISFHTFSKSNLEAKQSEVKVALQQDVMKGQTTKKQLSFMKMTSPAYESAKL